MKFVAIKIFILPIIVITLFADDAKSQTYNGIQAGKVMRQWMISGPIRISPDTSKTPDNTSQEDFFNRKDDEKIQVSLGLPSGGTSADAKKWIKHNSKTDIIDFDSIFHRPDYVSACAYAEIISNEARSAIFAIGSDDAMKLWHNGKLVHKNWRARAIVADEDIVPIELVKGKNQLLVEVQDIAGGWGFTARFLDKAGLTKRLVKAASSGDMDLSVQMIEAGADLNARTENGVTALDAARINGREDIVKLMVEKGAKESDVPAAEKIIESIYGPLNKKPDPGIAILIAKDGKVVYNKGYGYADINRKLKVTPDTKFRIGSITKQFIASAILKLQEEGRLTVNDKLSKYVPDFPRASEVTIHQLLTHTSGIHSFTNKDNFLVDVQRPITNDSLLAYFMNDPYDFNPGERYQYNNSGYFLAGYIIEKVTGERYGAYLKKQFFDPLGMSNTGVHTPSIKLDNEAVGYQKTDSGFVRALNWNMDWAGGAGSLYSTVGDLFKWNEAVFNGKVLNEQSIKAALTPVVLNNGSRPPGVQYGYGWGMNDYRDVHSIGHSGGLHGFVSQLLRIPKENLTVVMLTNVTPPQNEIDPMKIAELYLWKNMSRQSSFAQSDIKEENLDKYTGRYDFSYGMVMLITKEGDGLYAQMSGQPKFQIFPSAPGRYFWKAVEAKIHFITDDKGNVTHGDFEQGSFKVKAPKMKDLEVISLDKSVLEQYKGVYKYKEGTMVTVTTENGKLYGQATGDARFELLPLSETRFIIKELNATLTFSKDTAGKVNSVKIVLAGNETVAPRVQ